MVRAWILICIYVITVLSSTISSPSNTVANDGVDELILWPTYKYTLTRIGYYDIHPPRGFIVEGFMDIVLKWRSRSDLCIASSPALGDVDGDGEYEVIYNSCDGYLYMTSADSGEVEHKLITGGEFADPTLLDINGDGIPEILTVGAQGSLMCINGSGDVVWEIRDRMFRGSPGYGDFDGDGHVEVAMGSSDGYLYIVDPSNGSIREKLKLGDGSSSTPAISDVDNDGLPEIVIGESDNLHVVDYTDNRYIDHIVSFPNLLVQPPTIYRYHDDTPISVVADRDGHVYIVDLLNGSVIADAQLPGVSDIGASPSIGDVNGDGEPEIVVASMEGLFILDFNLRVLESIPEIASYGSSPIIADIDQDGVNDIVVGLESGEIMVINTSNLQGFPYNIIWSYTTGGPIMSSPALGDTDRDGIPELFIGSRDYYMYCFDIEYSLKPKPTNTSTITSTSTLVNTTTSTASTTNPYITSTTSSTKPRSSSPIVIPTKKSGRGLKLNIPLIIASLIVSATLIIFIHIYTSKRR